MGLFDDLVQPETKKTGIFSDLVGSTAVADPPMQAGGMDFDLSQFKDAPVMPPEVQGVDMARDSLLKRAAKNVYGEMTNVLKPDLPPIREIGQRNQLAEERAARESGGDPDTFFALREKYMNEYQARLTQGSGYIPQVAPPQSPGEFGVDIPTKIIPMLTKIVIMQRLGIPAPLAWEFENLTGGGAPGKGIAMQGILKGAEGLKLHPALKPAVPGGIFATEAAMAGGGPADIATAFLLPYALKTLELPKYAGDKLRAKGRANIINNMRKMLRDKKIDDSKIPDEALGAILDAAKKQKVWDKALRNKKITPETHIKRTAEVADSLVPIFAAIGRTQTVQPKPQEPLRIRPTRVVNEKSPGFGGGLNALPAEATMDKTPVMPRVSVKPDTSVGLRDRVAGDNFTMGAPTLVTPVSPQTELQNKVRGLVLQAAEGGRKGAGAQRKLDSLVNSNPALKEDADRLLYDALIEKAGSGDTKAVDKLQNEPKPTYDELLEKAYNGDPSAIGMIQRGEYREPASKPVEGKVAGVEQTTPQGDNLQKIQVKEAEAEIKKRLSEGDVEGANLVADSLMDSGYNQESQYLQNEALRLKQSLEQTAPQADAQAVKQPWEMETSEFIKDTEVGSRSNKTDEPSPNKYKEGDLMIDTYGEDPYVYELQYIDPKNIDYSLEGMTYEQVVNMPSTQKYIEWYNQGIEPPPITVVFNTVKEKQNATNRRRITAAIESGTEKIPAFVEIGRRKDMIKKALADGKQVPASVLAEYPDLQPTPPQAEPQAGGEGTKGVFSIEAVKGDRKNLTETATKEGMERIEKVEDYLKRIEITQTGRMIYPDSLFAKYMISAAEEFGVPQAEIVAMVYKQAIRQLSSPDNEWGKTADKLFTGDEYYAPESKAMKSAEKELGMLTSKKRTELFRGLTGKKKNVSEELKPYVEYIQEEQQLNTARAYMVGTKNTQFAPFRTVERELVKQREKRAKTEKLFSDTKGTYEGSSYQAIQDKIKGFPLPIRNAVETSFMRMAANEETGSPEKWPFTGTELRSEKRRQLVNHMTEDMLIGILLNDKPYTIEIEGIEQDVPGSPLSNTEKQTVLDVLDEANTKNAPPFPYLHENFLSQWNKKNITEKNLKNETDLLRLNWNRARKIMHTLAVEVWENKNKEYLADPEYRKKQEEKGIYYHEARNQWQVRLSLPNVLPPGKMKSFGYYKSLDEAKKARSEAYIDAYGKDYTGYDLGSMPRIATWPTLQQELDHIKKIGTSPTLKVIGRNPVGDQGVKRPDEAGGPELDAIVKRMESSSHAGEQTVDFRPGEGQDVTQNTDLIISNVGESEYEQNKDAKWIIAGRTFVDRDSGRITHEIYIEGDGRARVVAEEGYHPIVEALRIASPKDFGRIEQWHALRTGYELQSPIEGFTKLLSEIETGSIKGRFLKDLLSSDIGPIIERARNIFSGKEKLSPDTLEQVKESLPKGRSGVGPEGDYSIEPRDRKRAGFARLPSDILDKLPKSLQDKITKQKKSRGGFADFSELYDVYKKAKGDKPQQRKAREEIAEATTNAIKVAKAVPKFLLAGIEPSKLVEMKHGKQVYADVLKGTFGKAEKRLIEFEEKELTDLDGRVDELYEWFDQYPKSDLRNFMLSRGKPWTKEGKQLKDEATQNLPPEMTHSSLYKAINEIADRNYDFLTAVAGDNIEYVNDYFYGIFKNNDQVDKFLGFYKTTTRFTKEKKLPTVADAVAYGLELRNYNPVSNLRAEWSGIARLEGMVWLREELLKNGFGKYIDNSVAAPIEWKRIANGTEPVFKDFRVEPDLARMINNLIATNLVTANKGLSTLREINNVLRTIKFAGSVFHALVEASQAVADNPYLNPARKSSAAGLTFGFKKSDPIFKTPQYKEYIKLGGGHKYSAESQAVAAMDRLLRGLSHLPVIRIVGRPAAKVANLPVPPMPGFSKWMFDKWIPKIKYTKYLDEVMRQEKKLGRQLTEGEKIDIIKEGQNFYGEMNERLFGRSSTLTSVLRFFFLAPGFAEGNYRTEAKGAAQWGYKGGHRASRSRANMVNSLMIKAIIASIGTAIMTSKLPKRPKSMEDVKDIWKINTGLKDEHDREILIDTLTYDKDYANFLISLAQGRPDKVVTEGFRRLGGMKAPLFDIATDMAQLAMGKALYDWKGDRVIEITDPFLKAANKLAAYEFLKLEPIPVSVFKQARQKELSVAAAAIQSFSGVRPTYSEKDLREKKMLHKIYSLKGQQEELYQYLRTLKNPRKAISDYNATIEDVLSSKFIPQEMKDKWSPTLFVDTDRLLKNKKESYQSASHTLQEAEWIRDFIANFDEQAPPSLWDAGGTLPERLGSFVEYRRALNRQKESLTGKKMSLSKGLDAIQLKLTKLSKALAVTKDAKRQKIYINQAELLLDHADALRRDSQ